MPLNIKIDGNIKGLVGKLGEAKAELKNTFRGVQIGSMGGMLSASLWGAAATAAYKFGVSIANIAEEYRNLRNEAMSIGVSTADMARMSDMAKFSGMNLGDLSSAMAKVIDMELKAALGSKEAATQLEALGWSAKDFAALSPELKINAISNALNGIEDPAKRAAVALSLGKTVDQWNEMAQATQSLNLGPINEELDKMSQGWTLLTSSIGAAMKAAIAYSSVANVLKGMAWLDKKVNPSSYTNPEGKATTEEQNKAIDDIAKKVAGDSKSSVNIRNVAAELPVDYFRSIGAVAPEFQARKSPADQAFERLSAQIPEIVALFRKVDGKIPEQGGRY